MRKNFRTLSIPVFTVAIQFAAAAALFSASGRPSLPDDLGPAEIDVSGYPDSYQKTYREIFLPAFRVWGTTARVINSPIIEMDPQAERDERNAHPELFSDSRVAQPTADGWKRFVADIRRKPPCCGACPTLTKTQAKELWEFLVFDSLRRKTGSRADEWIRHREDLLRRFETEYPESYGKLYPQPKNEAYKRRQG